MDSNAEEGEPYDISSLPRDPNAEEGEPYDIFNPYEIANMEEGEPCDPRPTVAEEIEILQRIEESLQTSFDGKIDCRAWGFVKSALDSDIPEVKIIASRTLSRMAEYQD